MRCPDCNKFVAYDEPEVELESGDLDADGQAIAEVRVILKCADCGTELKDTTMTLEGGLDPEVRGLHIDVEGESQHELDADWSDPEASDYYDNPGRPSRYRRHIYIAEITCTVICSCGQPVGVIEMKSEEAASSFDELV